MHEPEPVNPSTTRRSRIDERAGAARADIPIAPHVRIDWNLHGVWRRHHFVPLSARTWAILAYLAQHPNTVIASQQLVAVAWPGEPHDPVDLACHIHRIRQAVEPRATTPQVVVTRRGVGYCLRVPACHPGCFSRN